MLTVSNLLADCGLELAAGTDRADNEIRWVHISELEDPTRWLSGGELLLSTGMSVTSDASQRKLVGLLAQHGAAGLGLGTGFQHETLPEGMLAEAERVSLPLFEVPFEKPFISVTEVAFRRLVNERYDVLEQGGRVQRRLERLVIEGAGLPEIAAAISAVTGGTVIVIDSGGAELVRHDGAEPLGALADSLIDELTNRRNGQRSIAFVPDEPALRERSLVVPVPGRRGHAASAWLAVVSDGSLGEFEALVARQAAMVIGLELMRSRVVRETERRLAGNLIADALSGRLDSEEVAGRLRPFGIGDEAAVAVLELEDPVAIEPAVEVALADAGIAAVVATTGEVGRPLLCVVMAVGGEGQTESMAAAGVARDAALAHDGAVRAGVSRGFRVGQLRRAFHEARCALEATSMLDGPNAPEIASHRDLGAFTLLLALQDDEALRIYSDDLLDPIEEGEGQYGGELLRSLEAFIENNGNWERAARQLYCHRHTLRYRIRKIEELTGRDLSRATDRIELWLALRARELVR